MSEDEKEEYQWAMFIERRDAKIAAQCKKSKLPKDTSGCLVGRKWTYEDYAALLGAIKEGVTIMDFARATNRSASGVEARLVKLGFIRPPAFFSNSVYFGKEQHPSKFVWNGKIIRRRQKVVNKKGDVIIDIGVILMSMGWERKEWDAIFIPSMFANKPIEMGV